MMTDKKTLIKPQKFKPSIVIPPGQTIKDSMDIIGMTQQELADRLGLNVKTVSFILNGHSPLTEEIALRLEDVFRTPAKFWLRLECEYQENKARIEKDSTIAEEEKAIAKSIPYPAISKLGWVPETRKIEEKVLNLRKFFGVFNLEKIPAVNAAFFRKQDIQNVNTYALATWLRMGELSSEEITTEKFNKSKLEKLIPTIRKMTREKPEVFYPALLKMLSSVGVCLVLTEHIPKTGIYGAITWNSKKNKAIIQLSVRGRRADYFWFTLFHELGHILNDVEKNNHFDDDAFTCKTEDGADNFASDTLIPPQSYSLFIRNKTKNSFSAQDIINFAKLIEIHPCIVIGRLQHDNLLSYQFHHDLIPKFIIKTKEQN